MRLAVAATLTLLLAGCLRDRNMPPVWARDIEKAINAMEPMTREQCGGTWSMQKGNEAASGMYVTGAYPERGEVMAGYPDKQKLRGFIERNADYLARYDTDLGTWCVTPKGDCHSAGPVTCYLDLSVETAKLEKAARLAMACNQISVAYLKRGNTVEIIDSYQGHRFGDGKPISGAALQACRKARGE